MFNGITSRDFSLCRAKYDNKSPEQVSPETGQVELSDVMREIDSLKWKLNKKEWDSNIFGPEFCDYLLSPENQEFFTKLKQNVNDLSKSEQVKSNEGFQRLQDFVQYVRIIDHLRDLKKTNELGKGSVDVPMNVRAFMINNEKLLKKFEDERGDIDKSKFSSRPWTSSWVPIIDRKWNILNPPSSHPRDGGNILDYDLPKNPTDYEFKAYLTSISKKFERFEKIKNNGVDRYLTKKWTIVPRIALWFNEDVPITSERADVIISSFKGVLEAYKKIQIDGPVSSDVLEKLKNNGIQVSGAAVKASRNAVEK